MRAAPAGYHVAASAGARTSGHLWGLAGGGSVQYCTEPEAVIR
jgi:hypothetical protein